MAVENVEIYFPATDFRSDVAFTFVGVITCGRGGHYRNLFYGFFHLRILGYDMHSQVVNKNMRKSTTENMFKQHYVQNVKLT